MARVANALLFEVPASATAPASALATELDDEIVTGPYKEISRGLNDGDKVKVTKRKKFNASEGKK